MTVFFARMNKFADPDLLATAIVDQGAQEAEGYDFGKFRIVRFEANKEIAEKVKLLDSVSFVEESNIIDSREPQLSEVEEEEILEARAK